MIKNFTFFQAAGTAAAGGGIQGEIYSWGNGNHGKTGLGTVGVNTLIPTKVGSFDDWSTIAAGFDHALALRDGSLYSWGNNTNGRTGLGLTSGNTTTPTQVTGFDDWEDISAGSEHSLAIRAGRLYSFGLNTNYQLGLNDTTTRSVSTQVGSATDWSAIACGSYYSIGLRGGTLYSWGQNANGGTGQGTATGDTQVVTQVGAFTDWDQIASTMAGNHCLAIRNGALYSWGYNLTGQLGLGDTTDRLVPTQVGAFTDWEYIACGTSTSFAIRNGTLYSWGNDANGGTGLGISTSTNTTTPTQVGSFTDWVWVSGGNNFGLGIRSNGDIYSWGNNNGGRTGQGTEISFTLVPTLITSFDDIFTSSCGVSFALAIRASGATPPPPPPPSEIGAYGWGSNAFGETGLGTSTGDTLSPTKIGSDEGWDFLSAGPSASAGILDGKLYTWGSNSSGQTGKGTTSGSTDAPGQIGSDTTWLSVSITDMASAIKEDGLYTTGSNANGKTGLGTTSGTTTSFTQASSVVTWSKTSSGTFALNAIREGKLYGCGADEKNGIGGAGNTSTLTQIGSSNDWQTCSNYGSVGIGIRNGLLFTWGVNTDYLTAQGTNVGVTAVPTQVPSSGSGWTHCAHSAHAVAIKNGELYTWGLNTSGQCGLGNTTSPVTAPTQVGAFTDWVYCGTGDLVSFAIRSNGDLYSWGNNTNGRTGLGTTAGNTLVPTQVGSLSDWLSVDGGSVHALGINATLSTEILGKLVGFGTNTNGQIGLGNNTNPILLPTVAGASADWTKVATGGRHTLAIRAGLLYTTGINSSSQLGNGNTTASNTLINIGAFADWTDVTGGESHSLGVRNGLLYSWGANTQGATGRGTTAGTTTTPTQVGAAIDWTQVWAMDFASWGVRANGTMWAWGRNDSSRLGLGVGTANFSSPQQMGTDTDWSYVTAGLNNFGFAIKTGGTLWSWGDNGQGRAAQGATSSLSVPTQVGVTTGWTHVACGSAHGIGIRNGQLYGWGDNFYGNVGDGTTTNRTTPTLLSGFTDWEWVACGYYCSFAIRKGKLYSWGYNPAGASFLGITGDNAPRLSPILVSAHETWKDIAVGKIQTTGDQHVVAIRG